MFPFEPEDKERSKKFKSSDLVLVFVPANVWRSFITCQIVDVKRQPTSSVQNDFFWKKLLFRTDGSFPCAT
jgi:hypothetical protein